jgi:hypothetical protein
MGSNHGGSLEMMVVKRREVEDSARPIKVQDCTVMSNKIELENNKKTGSVTPLLSNCLIGTPWLQKATPGVMHPTPSFPSETATQTNK